VSYRKDSSGRAGVVKREKGSNKKGRRRQLFVYIWGHKSEKKEGVRETKWRAREAGETEASRTIFFLEKSAKKKGKS